MSNYYIHPQAIVETKNIGDHTRIWAFVHILKDVTIGSNCNICDHCFIEQGVIIGNNVTVKSGIYIWEGATIEDDVFLGPNVVFTNDVQPRSKQYKTAAKILIKKGASIGANSTLLAGITIGEYAMCGIAAVVTRDVLPYALVYGNPAKQHGWVDESGVKMIKTKSGEWKSQSGDVFVETNGGLKKS